jgi:polysaccharide pyruvyl transferase WcaK-like protein
MAFALEPKPPSADRLAVIRKLDNCRPVIGLNVSGLLYGGGYTGNNMFALKADYRRLVCNLVQHFIRQGAHVLLVPHVFGKESGSESDVVACEQIHRELASQSEGRLHLLEGEYDQHEIKYIIGRCNFFLGSRMHACIAALSQGIPTIGLAYSRKFEGVLGSVGGDGLVIHLGELDCAEAVRSVEEAYGRRDDIRRRLSLKLPEVKDTVLNLFSGLVPCDTASLGSKFARHLSRK